MPSSRRRDNSYTNTAGSGGSRRSSTANYSGSSGSRRGSTANYSGGSGSRRRGATGTSYGSGSRRRTSTRSSGGFPWGKFLWIAAGVLVLILIISSVTGQKDSHTLQTPTAPVSPTPQITPTTAPTPTTPVPQVTQPAPTDPVQPSTEGLIYTDGRVPSYVLNDPQWETLHYEWERQDNLGPMELDVTVDRKMYLHYKNLERYHGVTNFEKYVTDPNNNAILKEIVKEFQRVSAEQAVGDTAVVREIAKFVQDVIAYEYDIDTTGKQEYPRYPIETLYEREADCEDTSILMAAMLRELGYEVGFLEMPGHLAVALRTADDYTGGAYYEFDGRRYLYIESTGSGFLIGEIPDDCKGVAATLYRLP